MSEFIVEKIEPPKTPEALPHWFLEGAEAAITNTDRKVEVRKGNKATPFINYQEYYNDLATLIESTQNENDAILICGWDFNPDAPITIPIVGLKDATIGKTLERADARKVPVRAIIYGHPDNSHRGRVAWFSSTLSNGGAIHDGKFIFPAGAHHQKMVVIKVKNNLIGYCGGMDVSPDRIKTPSNNPWHDVHVKIEGPAAIDILLNFYYRWKDQEDVIQGKKNLPNELLNCSAISKGTTDVQIIKTFPNLYAHPSYDYYFKEIYSGSRKPNLTDLIVTPKKDKYIYSFAPKGETTIYKSIINAIKETRFFIYLEDQYLVESERIKGLDLLTDVLRDTINKASFKNFIILTTGVGTIQGEIFQTNLRRARFWSQLGESAQKKTSVWAFKGEEFSPYWQHAKTWIFDDIFAIIASSNSNRRGYSSDSEIGAALFDNAAENLPFAHQLRIKLWLKHLNAKKIIVTQNDIIDFTKGATFWNDNSNTIIKLLDLSNPETSQPDKNLLNTFNPPPGTFASIFKSLISRIQIVNDIEWQWNTIIDPDGT